MFKRTNGHFFVVFIASYIYHINVLLMIVSDEIVVVSRAGCGLRDGPGGQHGTRAATAKSAYPAARATATCAQSSFTSILHLP